MVSHWAEASSVCEEEELLFLDAVLHVPTSAVFVLVQRSGVDLVGRQRGDDEAGIGALVEVLGLADDSTPTTPTVQGGVGEVLEHPSGLSRGLELTLGLGQLLG